MPEYRRAEMFPSIMISLHYFVIPSRELRRARAREPIH